MASIPGGQYTFFATGQPVNVVTTSDGTNLPPPIPGDFNLELITSPADPPGMPHGYQGVALESAGGTTIDLLRGDYGVSIGDGGPHTIIAGTGNDTIYGGNGPDTILGGSGHDLIFGGAGPDVIYAGAGSDTITAGSGPATIYGAHGDPRGFDRFDGGGHGDLRDFDRFDGHAQSGDLITGGSGNDLIIGGRGHETIDGGAGNNMIQVGSGPTLIQDHGVAGHDTVVGFDTAHGDQIGFEGENNASIDNVVATANENGGNTTISLPDGSTMTLVGITHIDHTFFH